jgi:cell division septum initiation protein DivIVA
MGLATQSPYEEVKPEEDENCDCKLDEFPKLEKDINDFGEEGEEGEEISDEPVDDIQALKDENQELKEKLAQIQDAIGALNEGMFDKIKAGWQGVKAGVQAGVQAGKEAGQQQYQQTKQAQEIETQKQNVISQLSQAKSKALKTGQINWSEIQKMLSQIGYKYVGGATPSVIPLEEGEEMGMAEGLEEGFGGFLKGAAQKIGGDIAKGVGNVAGKVAGVAQKAAGKVGQYTADIKAAGQQASTAQDQAKAEKQKSQEYISANYDKVINLLKQVK